MACKRRSSVHHRSGKTVAFCGFVTFQSPNAPIEVPYTLYFGFVNGFSWKKWRSKRVIRYTSVVGKLLLFVGSSTFRVQILNSKFHAHFLGKPKWKFRVKNISHWRNDDPVLHTFEKTAVLNNRCLLFGSISFAQHIFCELPITQFCVFGVGYNYISDPFRNQKVN